jgi:DNA-binding transcriptional LysR family regulator
MEIRQIKSFLSVAETLHFGKSSQLLHLSQPALSLQIKALEDELGVKLLDRDRQGTKITPAGVVFKAAASKIMEELEVACRQTQWTAAGKLGLIRLGFISTAGQEIVPTLIRAFRKRYPQVEFSLRNILTSEQPDLIKNGMLDVGFLRLPIDIPESIDITPVHREPFVAIFPLGHPLASKEGIRLRDLRQEKFVMYERVFAPGYHDLVIGILSRGGVIPEVSQTASEMSTIVSLVDSGMGVAVVPISAIKHRSAHVATCPILDKVPTSEIGMVTAKDTDIPVVRRFYELASELCRL